MLYVALAITLLSAEPSSPDRQQALNEYLNSVEEDYSEEVQMLGLRFHSPGYHSQVPDGTWVHPTRQNLDYAAALLERSEPGDAKRAAEVIRKVLSLQDTDPSHKTYGIWPWLLEEPLEKMAPPDWNWADFCGAAIALMLADYSHQLPTELWTAMRRSLGHAAAAIRIRDVKPGYTNICIMGAGVCATAGELLGDGDLVRYGRDRLRRTVEHAQHHGGFNEYNSPTYTMVALWECERTLHLVNDPETRAAAETLRRIAWDTIAGSFHPATGQWAGPHSRAYSDLLFPDVVQYLSQQTGVAIPPHPATLKDHKPSGIKLFDHLPCPKNLRSRFAGLPEDPLELDRMFVRHATVGRSTIGTTWHSQAACLGSINRSSFWTQRRVLLGYWCTPADPAVVLRLRFLHDGQDFASMGLATSQQANRVLSVLYPLRNQGDWHVSLDRPKDGVFRAKDFRVRYELSGQGVKVDRLSSSQFALSAGGYRAVVSAAASVFDGQPVRWEVKEQENRVAVEGVCYEGPERRFDFHTLEDIAVAAGIELIECNQAATGASPTIVQTDDGRVVANWQAGSGLTAVGEVAVK